MPRKKSHVLKALDTAPTVRTPKHPLTPPSKIVGQYPFKGTLISIPAGSPTSGETFISDQLLDLCDLSADHDHRLTSFIQTYPPVAKRIHTELTYWEDWHPNVYAIDSLEARRFLFLLKSLSYDCRSSIKAPFSRSKFQDANPEEAEQKAQFIAHLIRSELDFSEWHRTSQHAWEAISNGTLAGHVLKILTSDEKIRFARFLVSCHEEEIYLFSLFDSFETPEEWAALVCGMSEFPQEIIARLYNRARNTPLTPKWMATAFSNIMYVSHGQAMDRLLKKFGPTHKNLLAGFLAELYRQRILDFDTIYKRSKTDAEILSLATALILNQPLPIPKRREILLKIWGKPGNHFEQLPYLIRPLIAIESCCSYGILQEYRTLALTLTDMRLLLEELHLLTFLSDSVCADLERAKQLVAPTPDDPDHPLNLEELQRTRLEALSSWYYEWAISNADKLARDLNLLHPEA